jgi:hypothetical protein
MCTGTSRFVIIAVCGLTLSGCNRLGLCTEDHVDMIMSQTDRYQVEIVSKDCVGTSPVQEVLLRRTQGLMSGRTAVAVFDASNPDKPVNLSVKWQDERHLIITAGGAKVWSFQPNWHDVRIMER